MSANFRNVAIIAHVDHGKTTLVDTMLKQSGGLDKVRDVVERVMDSGELERERGITILGKATSIRWKGVKINIADTPGHADFGGEVERMLNLVDGVLLLVDASEGPLPQTRFVLRKALAAGLAAIVVLNKIDRPDARPAEVLDEVYDLFIDLGAEEAQIGFPVFYTNAKEGLASTEPDVLGENLNPLFDAILEHIPPPKGDPKAPLQALVTNLDYDNYIGRLGIGRVRDGSLIEGQQITVLEDGTQRTLKLSQLYVFEGLDRVRVPQAPSGEIFAVAGIDDLSIGDTLADPVQPVALPRVSVDEPTIAMFFLANTGPFSGLDGKYVTSRNIRERLERELLGNVSLRVEETEARDAFKVVGRGELALAILIEKMRREGFELLISRPEVVTKKDAAGKLLEPQEHVILDVPETFVGVLTQKLAGRKGRMGEMRTLGSGRVHVEYRVPSRGLIGFRSEFINDTRGLGVMNTLFDGWAPWAGDIVSRINGALVCDRKGVSTTYALWNLQPRGSLFLGPQVDVYNGMVIGEHAKWNDLNINPTKEKQLNNIRTVNKDEAMVLTPPRQMTLEVALQWIGPDEYVEATPKNIRIRKKELDANKRPKKPKPAGV